MRRRYFSKPAVPISLEFLYNGKIHDAQIYGAELNRWQITNEP